MPRITRTGDHYHSRPDGTPIGVYAGIWKTPGGRYSVSLFFDIDKGWVDWHDQALSCGSADRLPEEWRRLTPRLAFRAVDAACREGGLHRWFLEKGGLPLTLVQVHEWFLPQEMSNAEQPAGIVA